MYHLVIYLHGGLKSMCPCKQFATYVAALKFKRLLLTQLQPFHYSRNLVSVAVKRTP